MKFCYGLSLWALSALAYQQHPHRTSAFVVPVSPSRSTLSSSSSSYGSVATQRAATRGYLDNLGDPYGGDGEMPEDDDEPMAPQSPFVDSGIPTPTYRDYGGGATEGYGGPPPTLAFNDASAIMIQGNSLRTWALPSDEIKRCKISLKTEGRPLTSNIELWQGPDYTPSKIKVYVEDGALRPFNCVLETPMDSNTVAIYNTGNMEFPFYANVEEYSPRNMGSGLSLAPQELASYITTPRTVQGGSITSFPFPAEVESVQFLLKTDGRNLKARIELMQGPNNDKQVMEFYSSDGYKRPFFAIVETPGSGNVVRVINQNTIEFPFFCYIAPYVIGILDNPMDDNSFIVS